MDSDSVGDGVPGNIDGTGVTRSPTGRLKQSSH